MHRFLRQLAAELDKVAGHQNIEQTGGNLVCLIAAVSLISVLRISSVGSRWLGIALNLPLPLIGRYLIGVLRIATRGVLTAGR